MIERSLHLLAWDIVADRRRARVLKAVRAFGVGGQFSASECAFSPGELRELWHRLGSLVDSAEDRLLLLRLDPRARIFCLGTARPPDLAPFRYFG
ncbi:MAG: CRISPR-associated endonuclease Cas2 [Hyphomicrobiaceae bacterium]|nr:CRISPR-associated endonuclease Cas2 [Hyphomicrobiaceae bacterium]